MNEPAAQPLVYTVIDPASDQVVARGTAADLAAAIARDADACATVARAPHTDPTAAHLIAERVAARVALRDRRWRQPVHRRQFTLAAALLGFGALGAPVKAVGATRPTPPADLWDQLCRAACAVLCSAGSRRCDRRCVRNQCRPHVPS